MKGIASRRRRCAQFLIFHESVRNIIVTSLLSILFLTKHVQFRLQTIHAIGRGATRLDRTGNGRILMMNFFRLFNQLASSRQKGILRDSFHGGWHVQRVIIVEKERWLIVRCGRSCSVWGRLHHLLGCLTGRGNMRLVATISMRHDFTLLVRLLHLGRTGRWNDTSFFLGRSSHSLVLALLIRRGMPVVLVVVLVMVAAAGRRHRGLLIPRCMTVTTTTRMTGSLFGRGRRSYVGYTRQRRRTVCCTSLVVGTGTSTSRGSHGHFLGTSSGRRSYLSHSRERSWRARGRCGRSILDGRRSFDSVGTGNRWL